MYDEWVKDGADTSREVSPEQDEYLTIWDQKKGSD